MIESIVFAAKFLGVLSLLVVSAMSFTIPFGYAVAAILNYDDWGVKGLKNAAKIAAACFTLFLICVSALSYLNGALTC